VEINSS